MFIICVIYYQFISVVWPHLRIVAVALLIRIPRTYIELCSYYTYTYNNKSVLVSYLPECLSGGPRESYNKVSTYLRHTHKSWLLFGTRAFVLLLRSSCYVEKTFPFL